MNTELIIDTIDENFSEETSEDYPNIVQTMLGNDMDKRYLEKVDYPVKEGGQIKRLLDILEILPLNNFRDIWQDLFDFFVVEPFEGPDSKVNDYIPATLLFLDVLCQRFLKEAPENINEHLYSVVSQLNVTSRYINDNPEYRLRVFEKIEKLFNLGGTHKFSLTQCLTDLANGHNLVMIENFSNKTLINWVEVNEDLFFRSKTFHYLITELGNFFNDDIYDTSLRQLQLICIHYEEIEW